MECPEDVDMYRNKLEDITMAVQAVFQKRQMRLQLKRQENKENWEMENALRKAPYYQLLRESRPAFVPHDQCLRSFSTPTIDPTPDVDDGYEYKGDRSCPWADTQKMVDRNALVPEGNQRYRDKVARNMKKWKRADSVDAIHATTGYLKRRAIMQRLDEKAPFSSLVKRKPHWNPAEAKLRVFHPKTRPINLGEPFVHEYDAFITSPARAFDYTCDFVVGKPGSRYWKRPKHKTMDKRRLEACELFKRSKSNPSFLTSSGKSRNLSMELKSDVLIIE